jgi:hypothetical protein
VCLGLSSITAERDKSLLNFHQLNTKKEQGYGNKFFRHFFFVRRELMVCAYSKPSSRFLKRAKGRKSYCSPSASLMMGSSMTQSIFTERAKWEARFYA